MGRLELKYVDSNNSHSIPNVFVVFMGRKRLRRCNQPRENDSRHFRLDRQPIHQCDTVVPKPDRQNHRIYPSGGIK